jgi:ADP-ribose pyrophosphatase YjhB (NUDIX family)
MKYIIASGPVIIEKGKVLLNRHGKRESGWKFIGGDIYERKGTLEEWCICKAKEEMGVKVKIIRPLKPIIIWRKNETIILIHYLTKRVNKVIKPARNIREWGWFPIKRLPRNCAPNIKQVINEYLNN